MNENDQDILMFKQLALIVAFGIFAIGFGCGIIASHV